MRLVSTGKAFHVLFISKKKKWMPYTETHQMGELLPNVGTLFQSESPLQWMIMKGERESEIESECPLCITGHFHANRGADSHGRSPRIHHSQGGSRIGPAPAAREYCSAMDH